MTGFLSPSCRTRSLASLILLLLVSSGCGSRLQLFPVAGKVLVDGEPLEVGDIVLYPDDGAPLPSDQIPQGKLSPGGGYEIYTSGEPGAKAGAYRVVIISQTEKKPVRVVSPNHLGVYPLISEQYFSPSQTPLRIEVGPDAQPGAYDLAVVK